MFPNKSRMRTGAVVAVSGLVAVAAGASFSARSLQAAPPTAAKKAAATPATSTAPLTEDERILHVLNRLGFGARPGDVERVRAMGLERYVDAQLHPESIDDSAVDRQLSTFTSLTLSGDDYSKLYFERQGAAKATQAFRKEVEGQPAAGGAGKMAPAMNPEAGDPTMAPNGMPAMSDAEAARKSQAAMMAAATPEERTEILKARQNLVSKQQALSRVQIQLATSKLLRAVESQRQLQEVMVDFWTNHFNIDERKAQCSTLKAADDRDVIRPHALGKFRDLLEASAKSPAMLVYLDNYQSTSPRTPQQGNGAGLGPVAAQIRRRRLAAMGAAGANAQQAPLGKKQTGGLNENYGREIMELHTLGVDGGYTQKDVTEVARCFTGWSLSRLSNDDPQYPNRKFIPGGQFAFYPFLHDQGAKEVLGQTIPAGGGIEDGEKVLDILANSPATMRHISFQLCQRFVSDTPPQSLVDKCVATWGRTDGDIREILRTIVTSPEFYSRAAFEKKIKSPFEYAVSSVRALGGSYDLSADNLMSVRQRVKKDGLGLYNDRTLAGQINTMGEPLFQYQAPTGFPEDSHKWVSSGALISRLNFSLSLSNNKLVEIALPASAANDASLVGPAQLVDRIGRQLLNGEMSASTRATLIQQASEVPDAQSAAANVSLTTRLTALILGSPEFQRR